MVRIAAEVAGLEFTSEELEIMVSGLNKNLKLYEEIRNIHLDNSVPPLLYFNPVIPGTKIERVVGSITLSKIPKLSPPTNIEAHYMEFPGVPKTLSQRRDIKRTLSH
jgi:hypothetical protein